jgi:hypothetical protein
MSRAPGRALGPSALAPEGSSARRVRPVTSEDAQRRHNRPEILAAVLLSIAALLTSWASFQAALWNSRQVSDYSHANSIRVQGSTAALRASNRQAVDVSLFNAWVGAKASGDVRLADYYRKRFPPELRDAFEAWMKTEPLTNPKAPLSPFDKELFQSPGEKEAQALEAKAEAVFESGTRANGVADGYEQANVSLAITLFFGGITQVFRIRPIRLTLLVISVLACAIGAFKIAALPVLRFD